MDSKGNRAVARNAPPGAAICHDVAPSSRANHSGSRDARGGGAYDASCPSVGSRLIGGKSSGRSDGL